VTMEIVDPEDLDPDGPWLSLVVRWTRGRAQAQEGDERGCQEGGEAWGQVAAIHVGTPIYGHRRGSMLRASVQAVISR
jgi:hypothetical protein